MSSHIFTADKKIIEVDSLVSSSLDSILFATTFDISDSTRDSISKNNLNYMQIMFDNSPLFIASKYKFYKEIKKARSSKSNVYYILWKEFKDERRGFLIQYMPPNSRTSKHYHKEQVETFYCLEGSCCLEESSLEHFKEIIPISAGDRYKVKPLIAHPLMTVNLPCLNVIEIENVDYKDHFEVD